METSNFLVQIRNYQNIRKAKLEFIPGLNVLVGESSNGKSAVLRAIQTALFNFSRPSHVTKGETQSAVGIKYNGHEIIWRRDNTAASPMTYRVDGKVLAKLGRGQPPIIAELTRIREVELDDEKIRLNYSKQMSYPFLLDKTPSQLFKFIVQSAEEDNVMDVIQGMKTDLGQMTVQKKATEEARETLRVSTSREIKRYNQGKAVIPYTQRVIKLDSKVKDLERLRELVAVINQASNDIEKGSKELETLRGKEEVLTKTVGSVGKRVTLLESLTECLDEVSNRQIEFINFKRELVVQQNELESYKDVDYFLERLKGTESKLGEARSLRKVIDEWNGAVSEAIDSIEKWKKERQRKREIDAQLDRIQRTISSVEESMEKVEALQEIINEVVCQEIALTNLRNSRSEENERLMEIDEEMKEFEVCPFCGSEIGG